VLENHKFDWAANVGEFVNFYGRSVGQSGVLIEKNICIGLCDGSLIDAIVGQRGDNRVGAPKCPCSH